MSFYNGGIELDKRILESERLLLKALSYKELLYISDNEIERIENLIEPEAIFDFVKIAMSKKLEKMKNVDEKNHEWYTYWLIIDKSSQKGVGFIGFKGVPDENGFSEVGYSIASSCRRKGYMTQALSMLINWAANFENCKGITARKVLIGNIGSNNVLKNCKFKLISSTSEVNNYVLEF